VRFDRWRRPDRGADPGRRLRSQASLHGRRWQWTRPRARPVGWRQGQCALWPGSAFRPV